MLSNKDIIYDTFELSLEIIGPFFNPDANQGTSVLPTFDIPTQSLLSGNIRN